MCDMYINFWKPGCFVAWKVVYSALVGRMYGQVPGCQSIIIAAAHTYYTITIMIVL